MLSELGRAEAAASRPAAASHLEAAVALVGTPRERGALLLELGRVLHDRGRLTDASASFRRGLDEIDADGAGDTTELALDLEAGYLTSAMLDPGLAADAHRRVDAIVASDELIDSRAGRALASKAMIMRLFAGAPRTEIVAVAHRLLADGRLIEEDTADSQARTHVIGCLSWCDDFEAAEDALRLSFADARRRGSALMFAMASQLRARQRLWTGPIADAVADARAADEIWRRGAADVPATRPATAWSAGWSSRASTTRPGACSRSASTSPPRPASSRRGGTPRSGAWPPYRGDHAVALDAFLAAGRRLARAAGGQPDRVAVALGGRARRPAARRPRPGARPDRRGDHARRAVRRRRARSASRAAPPGCSNAARPRSSGCARPSSRSPPAARASSRRAR